MKKKKLYKNNLKNCKVELFSNSMPNENCPSDNGNCNCPQYHATFCVQSCGNAGKQ